MGLLPNPLPALDIGSLGAIKDEEGEEGGMHETTAAEEEGAEFGVLAFLAVGGVEEPDGGVDADAEAAERAVEGIKGEVGEGARLGGGAEHIPETSHSHRRRTYSNQTRDGVKHFGSYIAFDVGRHSLCKTLKVVFNESDDRRAQSQLFGF